MTPHIEQLRADPDLDSVFFSYDLPRSLLMAQSVGCRTNARTVLIEPTARRIFAVVPSIGGQKIGNKLDGWDMHSIHNGEMTPPGCPINS